MLLKDYKLIQVTTITKKVWAFIPVYLPEWPYGDPVVTMVARVREEYDMFLVQVDGVNRKMTEGNCLNVWETRFTYNGVNFYLDGERIPEFYVA